MLPEQVIREASEIDAGEMRYSSPGLTGEVPSAQRRYLWAHFHTKRSQLRARYLQVVLHHPDRQRPRVDLSHLTERK